MVGGPPGWNPLNLLPSRMPPHHWSMASPTVGPKGISTQPAQLTAPEKVNILVPFSLALLTSAHQAAPLRMIMGAFA